MTGSSTGVRPGSDPWLLPEDPFLETYLVRPGGATVVTLEPDERLTVVDSYGGQVAEVTVLSPEGADDADALGASADAPATVLRELVRNGNGFLRRLDAPKLDPEGARAVRLFENTSPPGSSQSFRAERAVKVVVAAPAGRIVDGAPPPSDLLVEIRRTEPRAYGQLELPAPLAEPRLDFRVDKATALAYEVRAGEYIQVIDVEGKQCSDFLAFHRGRLEDGVERGLDATVTRSITGTAYPEPGLFGKFYDADMNPLVEVVRDTVGRHDTFQLACYAKYYEDMGYPGHVNCTDNFNGALDPYGVAKREGWPALNFFFNTAYADRFLATDEPWSRPGDYVLLRALDDLVCASSACPDDIDPANGWQITDVHVRVYPAEHTFSTAIARRVTPDAEPVLTRETIVPSAHERADEELHRVPRLLAAALLRQRGRDRRVLGLPREGRGHGSLPAPEVGSPRPRRRDADPDRDHARRATALGRSGHLHRALQRDRRDDRRRDRLPPRPGQLPLRRRATSTTASGSRSSPSDTSSRSGSSRRRDQLHNVAVQGPASREILKKIVWTPPTQTSLEDLRWFRFLVGRIGTYDGIPIVVSRTGYTGELGYEVWCHPSDGPAVWDAIWEAGEEHGLTPLGLEALDILRIESGLIFAGYEFDDQVDPFEAGIGFAVDLETEEDFVGREALRERKAHPQRMLVGLELRGERDRGSRRRRLRRSARVGVVTSGTRSPVLKKNIALAAAGRSVRGARNSRSRSASSTASRSGSRPRSCASRSTTPRRRARRVGGQASA